MDVFDHRLAGDERKRFAWKTRRLIPRGDDGDNPGRTNAVREPSGQNDGHDESYTSFCGASRHRSARGKIFFCSAIMCRSGAARVSHHLGANRKSSGFAEEKPPAAEVFHKVFHRNC
jgi:hypothetical protein